MAESLLAFILFIGALLLSFAAIESEGVLDRWIFGSTAGFLLGLFILAVRF